MSNQKFTPGPWKAFKRPEPIGFAEYEIDFYSGASKMATDYANLIASAPEMFMALKMADSYFDACKDEWKEGEEMASAYIKSALLKATLALENNLGTNKK